MKSDMIDTIEMIGFIFMVVCLLVVFMWHNNLPTVKFSNATGDCVSVEQIKTTYSCDDLPLKYHRVIVK